MEVEDADLPLVTRLLDVRPLEVFSE